MALRNHFSVPVSCFDPVWTETEKDILHDLGLQVDTVNLAGKHRVSHEDGHVLFLFPHCGWQLSNNLLWANWNPQVRLANS